MRGSDFFFNLSVADFSVNHLVNEMSENGGVKVFQVVKQVPIIKSSLVAQVRFQLMMSKKYYNYIMI